MTALQSNNTQTNNVLSNQNIDGKGVVWSGTQHSNIHEIIATKQEITNNNGIKYTAVSFFFAFFCVPFVSLIKLEY